MEPQHTMVDLSGKKSIPNDRNIIEWVKIQPVSDQEEAARDHLKSLLESASQPRHASANSCVRLCHFLDQCRTSASPVLRDVAFSHITCVQLFNFYVEWNEKNQHRSMRQVLELLTSLIILNPNKHTSTTIKTELLQILMAILAHQSAQPFVKPAFKVIECFLSKAAICTADLVETLRKNDFCLSTDFNNTNSESSDVTRWWDSFVSIIFDWMSLPDTSPVAGKLLVTFFQVLRNERKEESKYLQSEIVAHSILWQQWIRDGLARYPDSLENIKNYLLPPLFKIDRNGSLEFLRDLAEGKRIIRLENRELDAQAFLFLSAMEVGKKAGLVDEPYISKQNGSTKQRSFILLPEDKIGPLLAHKLGSVRSAAFSVLVSSISSVRPFTSSTLNLLKRNLGILHVETDAKVRNQVLSHTKHMLERLRGSILLLARDHNRPTKSAGQSSVLVQVESQQRENGVGSVRGERSLQEHQDFLKWYLNFLSNELVPTASYQCHITALRAFQLVTKSGILMTTKQTTGLTDRETLFHTHKFKYDGKLTRLLMDLLMDPFEDVRAAAMDILRIAHLDSFTGQTVMKSSENRVSDQDDDMNTLSNEKFVEEMHWYALLQKNLPGLLIPFIMRAESASARTGRADLADGVARTFEIIHNLQLTAEARLSFLERLIMDLESKIAVAEHEISSAVLHAPVHGLFTAIRLIWDQADISFHPIQISGINNSHKRNDSPTPVEDSRWIALQDRMVRCCQRIWVAVKDVLCNDSPEGHLPQELDELDMKDTKDVLSYSFRAIHESSNLLRTVVSKHKLKFADDKSLVTFQVLRAAGNLSFEQLSTLRHRGAFSTVSLTFSTCCKLTLEYSESSKSGLSLLDEWYQGTMACINEQTSTTRRSAGIPSLMTGILASNSPSPSLKDAIAQLRSLASQPVMPLEKDETNLPQVHAMNCIKEIFKSAALGRKCESQIADCLQLAAESLKSKIWAIRNCGLLLLRSLIDCLFGTSESKLAAEAGWDGKSIRLSYERYPALPELLLRLLAMEAEEGTASRSPEIGAVESVFPALDIIRRAGPPKLLRGEIYSCIRIHLGSEVLHIRDISARTICTLLLEDNWLPNVLDLLETCGESANSLHGVLLAVRCILERRLELQLGGAAEYLPKLNRALRTFWDKRSPRNMPPTIQAAYEDLDTVMLRTIHAMSAQLRTMSADVSWREFRASLINENIFNKAMKLFERGKVVLPDGNLLESNNFGDTKEQSALLIRAITLNALYAAAIEFSLRRVEKLLIGAVACDADTTSAVLDHMPLLWVVTDLDPTSQVKLARMYIKAYSASFSNQIRANILRNLAEVLENHSRGQETNQAIQFEDLFDLRLLPLTTGSPDLSNAGIRISGSILALQVTSHSHDHGQETVGTEIETWGCMMSEYGNALNDFDTRLAAVTALGAFFSACNREILASPWSSFLLPSFLALYDTMNDDDDDIREAGARVVSTLLGVSLAPLAACEKLLRWLQENFGETDSFSDIVIRRITNTNGHKDDLQALDMQLSTAMLDDDSLFVEEEQNLYIDEVRETNIWTTCLLAADHIILQKTASQLSTWTLHGLEILTRLAMAEEGPYGCTSKPRVFAICMRIVRTAKVLVTQYHRDSQTTTDMLKLMNTDVATACDIEVEMIEAAMRCLLVVGRDTNFHPAILQQLSERALSYSLF